MRFIRLNIIFYAVPTALSSSLLSSLCFFLHRLLLNLLHLHCAVLHSLPTFPYTTMQSLCLHIQIPPTPVDSLLFYCDLFCSVLSMRANVVWRHKARCSASVCVICSSPYQTLSLHFVHLPSTSPSNPNPMRFLIAVTLFRHSCLLLSSHVKTHFVE